MQDYYSLLGVGHSAVRDDIKKAFREKAKSLHPDIAGEGAAESMRALIAAYETLLDSARRAEYDRALLRRAKTSGISTFDYRDFLQKGKRDPKLRARLIFYELLRGKGGAALETWREAGGLSFHLRNFMDREDWMDCAFLLAEELDKAGSYSDALAILQETLAAEIEKPYFKHFALDLRIFIKSLTKKTKFATISKGRCKMNIEIKSAGFSLTEEEREFAGKKIERFRKAEEHVNDIVVTFTKEAALIKAEAFVNFKGGARGHLAESDYDFRSSCDKLVDKLQIKITKEKEKSTEHHPHQSDSKR